MIRELTLFEFEEYASKHPLRSYHQTSSYALLMASYDYKYQFIGYVNENNVIVGASLILIKKINKNTYYGYAPKGFLIDYFNEQLLLSFTRDIIKFHMDKGIIFIKINPEIAIGFLTKENEYKTTYNNNVKISEILTKNGYLQCKPKYNFESLLPRFNGFVNINNLSLYSVEKNMRNKVKKGERKGLYIEKANKDGIEIFFEYVKFKKKNDKNYYYNYYTSFEKNNNVDLFLLKINYTKFLINAQDRYRIETEKNEKLNSNLAKFNNKKTLNAKMDSDKILTSLNNDIVFATNKLKEKSEDYLGGVLIIKYEKRIYFVRSGFDPKFASMNPNHFMYYKVMEHYKNEYTFADLCGISGTFNKNGDYSGLNKFKLAFNPKVYEFIGEFDLIINKKEYEKLVEKDFFSKEFYN